MNAEISWQSERKMSPVQYRRVLKLLGISNAAAARFLDVSHSTAWRYYHGKTPVPVATALLLTCMVELAIKPVVPPTKAQHLTK